MQLWNLTFLGAMLLDTLLAAVVCKATNPGAPFIYLFFGAE